MRSSLWRDSKDRDHGGPWPPPNNFAAIFRRANKGFLAPLDFEALRVKIGDDTGALFNGEAGASFLVGRVKLRFAFSDHRFRHEKKTCEGVPVGVIRNSITRGMGCQCSAYLEMKAKDDEAVARENAA